MAQAEEVIARYTRRAEELRTIAGSMRDPENRQTLLEWASTYDRLAQRAVEVMSTYMTPQQQRTADPDEISN